MASSTDPAVRPVSGRGFTDHARLGMAIFVFTEVMLFTGFLSAFAIVRNAVPAGLWPPEGQPRLPFASTAWNTAALLLSGLLVLWTGRVWKSAGAAAARRPLGLALLLGAAFVGLQGREWVGMLAQGLTLTSSQLGSFFYLIIGLHALHALIALAALAHCWVALGRESLTSSRFGAWQVFWGFVVLMWPVLWLVVYR